MKETDTSVNIGFMIIKNTQKVDDSHLVNLMQYYELVNELKNL